MFWTLLFTKQEEKKEKAKKSPLKHGTRSLLKALSLLKQFNNKAVAGGPPPRHFFASHCSSLPLTWTGSCPGRR